MPQGRVLPGPQEEKEANSSLRGGCPMAWTSSLLRGPLGGSWKPRTRQLAACEEALALLLPVAQPSCSQGQQKWAARGLDVSLCPRRCTLRTPWGSGSGWTARTAKRSWTTSRQRSTPGCPPRACSCRGRQGAAEGTSVLVREAGSAGKGTGFSEEGALGLLSPGSPALGGVAHGTGGCMFHEASICREQPTPLAH